MSTGVATDTFHSDPRIITRSLSVYVLAAILGGLAYGGTTLVAGGVVPPVVAVAVGIGAVGWFYGRAKGTTYSVYPDRIVEEIDGPVRTLRTEVYWDEVALATREQSDRAESLGIASFELVRADADDLEVKYVADPDRFERLLADRLPDPDEWLAERPDGDTAVHLAIRQLRQRPHLWRERHREDPWLADEYAEQRGDSETAPAQRADGDGDRPEHVPVDGTDEGGAPGATTGPGADAGAGATSNTSDDADDGAGTGTTADAGSDTGASVAAGAGVVVTEEQLADVLDVDVDDLTVDRLGDIEDVDDVGDVHGGDFSADTGDGGFDDGFDDGGGFDGGGGEI